jgi:4-hydroxy-tetrahydrodipicolinate reductase
MHAARGADPDQQTIYGRRGRSARTEGQIAVHAVRAGGNAGEHVVLFADEGEEIRVAHRALSRRAFAQGAVRAARFLAGQPAGYYTMDDLDKIIPGDA